tara:strand:+ start:78 stop:452 length:375 start_codon:yes stop_codon:yes gene_type:complete
MADTYKNLSEAQKKQYNSILGRAKSMQTQGKLMFKDLNKLKSRVGESLGKMPNGLTLNPKKEMDSFLKRGKNPQTQMNKASDEIKKIVSKINKEYTALRKSAGMSPERNMKATGGKITTKKKKK